jgi:hypothetical protein
MEQVYNADGFRELLKNYTVNRWKLTNDQLNTWSRLDKICPREIAFDCAVNVVTFLNLLDRKMAKPLARIQNVLQKGISTDNVSPLIYEDILRKEYVKTEHEFFNFDFSDENFDLLTRHIRRGYATILAFQKGKGSQGVGHFVIFFVNPENGYPVLLDPQQETYYSTSEQVASLVSSGQYTHFGLFLRNKREKRHLQETQKRVRKETQEEPTRKRRRIGSPSPAQPFVYLRDPSESMERDFSEGRKDVSSSKKRGSKKRSSSRGKSQKKRPMRRPSPSPILEEGEVEEDIRSQSGDNVLESEPRAEEISYPRGVSPAYQPARSPTPFRFSSSPSYDPTAEPEPQPVREPTPPPTRRSTRSTKKP